MQTPLLLRAMALTLVVAAPAVAADSASGSFTTQGLAPITATHAVGYRTRDASHPRTMRTEILLTDLAVDGAPLRAELDPHMAAINVKALNDRNYILLFVSSDGQVSMNATYSKTMTQFIDSAGGFMGRLKATLTTNTATRVEGTLTSGGPLKTMDGTPYTVNLTFAVDVPAEEAGQPLAAGGGDPGKAFVSLITAAQRKNWAGIKAGLSSEAVKMFDKDYNTPAENAASALDMFQAWIPMAKMKVAGGQLRGNVAILDVEGEKFPGMGWLSVVKMVKTGTAWQFDRSAQGGSLTAR